MVELVVKSDCPCCDDQERQIKSAFREDEFRIIKLDSPDFANYEFASQVEFVPLIVIRRADGKVEYAAEGFHDAAELRRIISSLSKPFNLRRSRKHT